MPFIVVNMARETEIDCSISEDQFEYHLKFSREFELHDELEILKRLGLADATNAENLLPPKLRHFLRLGQNYAKSSTDKNSTISTTVSSTNSSTHQNSSQNNSDHQIELIEMSDSAKEVKLETNVSRSLFNEWNFVPILTHTFCKIEELNFYIFRAFLFHKIKTFFLLK